MCVCVCGDDIDDNSRESHKFLSIEWAPRQAKANGIHLQTFTFLMPPSHIL